MSEQTSSKSEPNDSQAEIAAQGSPERLRAMEARLQELEAQLAAAKADTERRSAAEAELRARAAQRTAQARQETAETLFKLAQIENAKFSWIPLSWIRRMIEVSDWTISRRLTEKLRQRSIEPVRGRLRAAAYYVVHGPVMEPFAQAGPGQASPSPSLKIASRSDGEAAENRLVFISGEPESAGHTYRILRYVDAARAIGADASWIRLDEIAHRSREIGEADALFIWRAPWDKEVASAIELARRSATKVVFDIDDLLVDPNLARSEVIAGIADAGVTEKVFQRQCERWQKTLQASDYCTVPTKELAEPIRRMGIPTLVLPNGFDRASYQLSRRLARRRRSEKSDGLIRIGYAGGTPTHRRDFAVAATGLAQVLRERPQCRLVLFRFPDAAQTRSLNVDGLGVFAEVEDQIEWRNIVPLPKLPEELVRFDINIAPLEVGNVFCEAKSELKFFEAALFDVPTVASPTGPFRRAMCDGVNAFLANGSGEWYSKLLQLVDDASLRLRLGRAAHHDSLKQFGPLRRSEIFASGLPQLLGDGRTAARALALELHRKEREPVDSTSLVSRIPIADFKTVFEADQFGEAEVTVVFALSDDPKRCEEALGAVSLQTVRPLDLIVIGTTTANPAISAALDWARRNVNRFNRLVVFSTRNDSAWGAIWNGGIDVADTPFVLLLPDSFRISPDCVEACLKTICEHSLAFSYPRVRNHGLTQINADKDLGDATETSGADPFDMVRLTGNADHLVAPLLLSKEAWAMVDGCTDGSPGSAEYDFWRRLITFGLGGNVAAASSCEAPSREAATQLSPGL
jgi:glycosyltransferase involved in cell wall biosynthesis